MKRTKMYLTALAVILLTGIIGAEITGSPLKKLVNRNNTVPSEVYEPQSMRSLSVTRIGQNGITTQNLTDNLSGAGISTSNAQYTGRNLAGGVFTGGSSAGFGFGNGVILSSGAATNAIGPNTTASKSTNNQQPGDADLDILAGDSTYDAAVLEFDFVPQYNKINLNYLLASEEYPEMIDYADVMAIYVDGVNIALIPGTPTPVSITSINHLLNSQYYVDNLPDGNNYSQPYTAPYDTQADGFTIPLRAIADVTAGQMHHIKIAVADLGDNVYDTWLLLQEAGFYSAADLAMDFWPPLDPVSGTIAMYTLHASNLGVISAANTVVNFRLPLGSTLQSLPAGVVANAGSYTWTIGNLPAGEQLWLDLNCLMEAVPPGIAIAEISSATLDNDSSNNRNLPYTAPAGAGDSYSITEDTPLNVGILNGVLINDSVYSVNSPSVEMLSSVTHGTLNLSSSGAFIYSPVLNYHGTDSFSYRIYDGTDYSSAVTVQLNITPVNDPPVLNVIPNLSMAEDTSTQFTLATYASDADGDTLSVAVTGFDNGIWNASGLTLAMQGNLNWFGSEAINIAISDGEYGASRNLNLTVTPVQDISTNPPSLAFGNVLLGSSQTQRLYVHNTGSTEAMLQAPFFTSSNAAFAFTAPSATQINSGGSIYTDVTFTPTQSMDYNGTLGVINNVFGESPHSISLSGTALNFPEIVVNPAQVTAVYASGSTHDTTLTISNTGQTTLNWSVAMGAGSPAWMSIAPLSGSVAGGASQSMMLSNHLEGVAAGVYPGSIIITSNAVNQPELLIPVSITVTGIPQISILVSGIDFGSRYTGINHSIPLEINNSGSAALEVTASTTLPYTVAPATLSIPAFQTGTINVALFSLTGGHVLHSLVLDSNSGTNPHLELPVSADLITPPTLLPSTYEIQAFTIAETGTSKTLRITNTGSQPLIWQGNGQYQGGQEDWLNINPALGTIPAGGQQNVVLGFNPAFLNSGVYSATLVLSSNDPLHPNVPVSVSYVRQDYYSTFYDNNNNANADLPDGDMGVQVAFNSPLNPIEFNVYSHLPEVNSARLVVRAEDVGEALGENCEVSVNGYSLGILRGHEGMESTTVFYVNPLYLDSMGKNLIQISVDTNEQGDGILVRNAQLVINNMLLDAQIRYVQTDQSSYITGENIAATIEIDTQLSNQALMVETSLQTFQGDNIVAVNRSLTINAMDDDAFVETLPIPQGLAEGTYKLVVAVYDQSTMLQQDMMYLDVFLLPNQPRISLSSAELNFGILPEGISGNQQLHITNVGNLPLIINSFSGQSEGLNVIPASATIDPGVSQPFVVHLTSTAIGTYNNTLLINCNDPDTPVATVNVTATIISNEPYVSTDRSYLEFGECFTGTLNSQELTISNLGPVELQVSSLEFGNSAWQADIGSFALGYNQSRQITISINTPNPGNYNSVLVINSNATNSSQLSIPIYASLVLPPQLSINPSAITATVASGENVHPGILIGNTGGSQLSWGLSDNLGKAVHFGGYAVNNAEFGIIANRSNIQLATGAFTVSLWAKSESNTGGSPNGSSSSGGKQYLLSKSTDDNPGFFGLYLSGVDDATHNQDLVLHIRTPQGISVLRADNTINLNQWFHVAATYAGGIIRLFLNGDQVAYQAAPGFVGNTSSWVLGKYGIEASRYYRFQGALDELRIFDVAQTSEYIKQTMQGRLESLEPNLCGYWKFDTANLNDSTSSNNHGLVNGATTFIASTATPVPEWISCTPSHGNEPAGTAQSVSINLSAVGRIAGQYVSSLTLKTNDQNASQVTIPVVMNVTGAASVSLDPVAIAFGDVIIGQNTGVQLSVTNNGTATLELTDILLTNPVFSCSVPNLSVDPQASQTLTIGFLPPNEGAFSGFLSFDTNISTTPHFDVPVSGNGALPPVLSYNPPSFSQDLAYGNTASRTLTISNSQGMALNYHLSLAETSRSNASGEYLNLVDHCKGMTWLNGYLYFLDFDTNTLGKYDPEAQSTLQTWSIPFSPYGITTDGSILYVGSATGRIYRYSDTGVQLNSFTNPLVTFPPTIAYYNNALFISNSNQPNAAIYKLTTSGGLAATYTSILPRNTQVLYVGEHAPAPFYGLQPSLGRIVRFKLDAQTTIPVDTLYVPMGNAYALAHNGRDFYLLENAKNYMTRIDDGEDEFNWISLSIASGSVPAGNVANVNLGFSAINTFAASYNANLILNTNDPLHSTQIIPLVMNVSGQASLAYDPVSVNYGVCYQGYPFSRKIHLENNGSAELLLTGIVAAAPFSCSQNAISIPPWQSYDLDVVYTPVSLGHNDGMLTFATNDPDRPQVSITLNGSCTEAPHLVVNPPQITESLMSDASTIVAVQVQNTGITPLSITLGTIASSRDSDPATHTLEARNSTSNQADIDRLAGQETDQYPFLLQNAGMMAINDTLYVVSFITSELVVQTLNPLQVLHRYPIHDHPYGIAWDGSYFWIGGQGGIIYPYLKSALHTSGLNQPAVPLNTDIASYPAFTIDNGDLIVANTASGNAPTTFRRYRNRILQAEYYSSLKNISQLTCIPNYGSGNIWAYQNLITNEAPSGGNLLKVALESNHVSVQASYPVWDNQITYTLAHDGNDFLISDIDGPLLRVDDGVWLGSSVHNATLAAGSGFSIPVKLDPADGVGGDYSGQVVINSNDPANPQLILPVSLSVTGYPRILANPSPAVIDTTMIGNHRLLTLTFSNPGNDVLVVSSLTSSHPDFVSSHSQFTIPAHGSSDVTVTFSPSSEGELTTDLTVLSNASDFPILHIPVTAYGLLPRANIVIQPAQYDFGGVYTNAPVQHNFLVRNTGTANLVISGMQSPSGAFSVGTALPLAVPVNGQKTLSLIFAPSALGNYQETVDILSNSDPNPQYGLVLAGTGLQPFARLVASPVPINFGTVIVTMPHSLSLHLTNNGQLPLNISQISSDLPPLGVETTNLVIPAGQSRDVQLDLTAIAPGQITGNLLIISNDPDHPQLSIPVFATAILGNPAIQVNPGSISFGEVVIGSNHTQNLTITNTGNLPLLLSSIRTSQPAFSVSQASGTLAPQQSLELAVTYTPSSPVAQNAILLLQNNSPANPMLQVPLYGMGQHPVYYSVNPEIIDEFTNTPTTLVRNLIITNTSPGNLAFQLSKLNPNASWLSFQPSTGTVTPGNTARIQVSLNTSELNFDLYETQLKISSNSQSAPEKFIPVYLNYSNYNITTNDNEDNQGHGVADGDMDLPITYANPLAPVEFNIFTDAVTVNQAQLRIVHQNVLSGQSNRVYLNNQLLGTLAPQQETMQESYFNIPPSYLGLGVGTPNTVRIDVDETHINPSGSNILLGQLIYNAVFQNATITDITAQPTVITPDTLLSIIQNISTNLYTQSVRIETKLFDSLDHQQLNTISRVVSLAAYQNSTSSATWNLANQVPPGAYHVVVSVYDALSNQLQASQRLDLMIRPDTPTISLDSASLEFGNVFSGYPSTRELVIHNLGAATLIVNVLHFSNSHFTSPVSSFSIAPSSSFSLPVTVNTSALGLVNANLTITSNDPETPTTEASLQATVINPPHIGINPSSVAVTMLQYDTATREVQISNTGLSPLHLGQPYLENLSWASLSPLAAVLNPGQQATLNLAFNSTGIEQGLYMGTLFLPSDDPDNALVEVHITVDVTPQPLIAEFSASPLSGPAPLNVQFTSMAYTTDGSNVTSWEWDFDSNGSIDSTIPNPTHTYASAGSYSVALRVFSDSRAQHRLEKSDYIFVINNDPGISSVIPEITIYEDSMLDSLNVGAYFYDPDNDPLAFSVSPNPHLNLVMNNSILSITPEPDYNGVESITITATDTHGSSVSQSVLVHVIPVNDGPSFHDLPQEFAYLRWTSLPVDFTQYIHDPDTDSTLITISVSGNVNTTCIVSGQMLTFSSLGDWFGSEHVMITINDNATRTTASANVTLNVLEGLVASFYADSTDVYAGIPVQFTNTVPGNPTNYEWDFENDGVVDNTEPNPHHTYDLGGWYSVRLRVLYIEAGVIVHSDQLIRPNYIHITGTHVPGGALLSDWILAGSPYNITGPVVIPTATNLTWNQNVEVNIMSPAVYIKVQGSLQADNIDVRTFNSLADHWLGFQVDPGAGAVSISNSSIRNAQTPFLLRAPATIQNCTIMKDSLLVFQDDWAIQLEDAGPAMLSGIDITDYSNGLLITSPTMASQPTLSNIRVRNSSNSIRTDSYGMKVLGSAAPQINSLDIQNFTIGAYYEGTGQTLAAPVLISNIRVRNSSNSIRSLSTGIWVKNLLSSSITSDSLTNCENGVVVDNTLPNLAAQTTISNIRVRNSSNSIRTPSQGITITGNVIPTIFDVDIDDYTNGIILNGTNAAHATQPLLSNIRVRNSSNSIRNLATAHARESSTTREPDPDGVGIYIKDFPLITVAGDSIFGYIQGFKIENSLPSMVSQPTLSNIRVRNSSNSIRNTGVGVYAGPGVKLGLENALIEDYGVGVSVYGNDSQITSNRFLNNDNALLMQATLPGFRFANNELILAPNFPVQNSSAMAASNVLAGTLNNNTIVNYPKLLVAENSSLTFIQNIGWSALALSTPFQNTNSLVNVRFNDIRYAGGVYPGAGNINLDPLFTDAVNMDHHLTFNSPCIDAGDPAWAYDEDESISDMGAFPYLHNAAFTSDQRYVLPNTTIQFTNTSIGHPQQQSTYAWDFQNDGVVDSNLENPTHTFAALGRYHVKLVVSSGALVDTLLLMNYVLVQNSLLPAPQQVQLYVAENDTRLNWQPVTHDLAGNPVNPNYYLVYTCAKPLGQFRYTGQSAGTPEFTHLEGGVKNQMFYVVIAFTGTRAQLDHYLLQHEYIEIKPVENNDTPNDRNSSPLTTKP